ncbi:LuxR C-terminal-related transcriptional regulator [Candidatus Leptofilum sp.]|uniref:LuxR C-terminal-related transcriptional regulator n=1 Tax=Candidatus Leptofilum sp. TaxID=3241576 RepID=UPI003B595866
MSDDLLKTKLFVPRLRPLLVPRPRLFQKLNRSVQQNCKLILVSAPAGFGKTTLVSDWIAAWQRASESQAKAVHQIAWLSLDARDNDFVRFLTYIIAAIQTFAPAFGAKVTAMLQSPQLPSMESLLTMLLNEIATVQHQFILVLDDYHLIDEPGIDEAVAFVLAHMPPQMVLVITTREEPNLPLPRFRVRGQLAELRTQELRFTLSEATQFLNQVMGFDLSAAEIAALDSRTEGWIAGLQIAALALQGQSSISGRDGTADFIQAFSGSHRFVMDYLVSEILQQQPEPVRSFLLQTAVLERLGGSLCDAVTGGKDSQEMLQSLDHHNLFLISLDGDRKWYRYHHLFADVLQKILMKEQPELVSRLHQRASQWYEQNELYEDAIRHALIAKDFAQVANLAELAWQAMDRSFHLAVWLRWVKKLPEALIRTRPVLCTQYAEALSNVSDLETSELRLRHAEQLLNASDSSLIEMVVIDEQQFRSLPAKIALVRAGNAQISGNIQDTKKYSQLALKLTPEADTFGRAQAIIQLGFTNWMSGDLEAARQSFADWIERMQQLGNSVFALASSFALADILIEQGQLREAIRAYQQALHDVAEDEPDVQRIISIQYLGLTMLYHELGDRESASRYLQKSRAFADKNTLINWPYRWRVAQARLKESAGELGAALHLLDEASRVYVINAVPDIRPVEALKVNLFVKQGRLDKAMAWVHNRQISANDEVSYLHEFELITLARVLMAGYENGRKESALVTAMDLLARLLTAAEAGGRMRNVLQILILQAIAQQLNGDLTLALRSLERALRLGAGEGYVGIFVDEGVAMGQLLREAAVRQIMPDYTGKLLAAFAAKEQDSQGKPFLPESLPQPLIEPLTQRELDVLRLLKSELSGPEIARELVVALSTVRTHTKSIYSKLNVNNRRTAVKRAEELHLI